MPKSPPTVFISYAREDLGVVRELYNDLKRAGANPWLDEEFLLPGQRWRVEIKRAIRESRYFLVVLSPSSVSKRGHVQKELAEALDILDEFPESEIFIIPVRLDDCSPSHEKLCDLQWVDMFPLWNDGFRKILRAIEVQPESNGIPWGRVGIVVAVISVLIALGVCIALGTWLVPNAADFFAWLSKTATMTPASNLTYIPTLTATDTQTNTPASTLVPPTVAVAVFTPKATPIPPTNTPMPPTDTSTPELPTSSTLTPTPTPTATPTNTPSPTPTLTPTPTCPPAAAEGTVPPVVAISSITFIVKDVDQVVRDADALQASPGDQVQIREVTICTVDPFEGSGGQVYVEFDPVDQNGQVIASEVKSTQDVRVTPGFTTIQGPDYTWTIGNWRHISVVTVHYPPGGGTKNLGCEGGLCEDDDRVIVRIQ